MCRGASPQGGSNSLNAFRGLLSNVSVQGRYGEVKKIKNTSDGYFDIFNEKNLKISRLFLIKFL